MVGAHRIRIEQNFFFPRLTLASVDDVLLLVGCAFAVEEMTTALDRRTDAIDFFQLGDSLFQPLAARPVVEQFMGVVVLLCDPCASLGRVLIFEPAIGISDRQAVQSLLHVARASNRRRRHDCASILSAYKRTTTP